MRLFSLRAPPATLVASVAVVIVNVIVNIVIVGVSVTTIAEANVPLPIFPSPRFPHRRATTTASKCHHHNHLQYNRERLLRDTVRIRSGDGTATIPTSASASGSDSHGNSKASNHNNKVAPGAGGVSFGETDEDGNHMEISKSLRNRNATNMRRKFTHAGFGIFFACLNQFLPHAGFVKGMVTLTSATLLMELLRYRRGFGWMNAALHFVLGKALRKHEMEGKFTGSFYYFAGVTACAKFFPQTAGTMGICQLALADPSASYFGKKTRHVYWSRIENGLCGFGRNKGILGFLGGALFCFPFNYRVFKIARWGSGGVPGGETAIVAASILLGLAGAFADLAVPTPALTMPKKILGVPVPPFHVDDNFVVPIFSGWACTKIFQLVGWDDGLELEKYIIFRG